MAADQGQGGTGDFADELLEALVVLGPCFDFRDQLQGHIDGAGAALLFEGQVPAGLRAAGAGKGAEAAFDEGADLSDLAQGTLPSAGVPVLDVGTRFHIGKLQYLLLNARRK